MPHNQGGDVRRQPSALRDDWAAWMHVACPAARDQLLHHYFLELVEPIARAQHRQLPPSVELGDLEQAGYLGLHDALQRFDNRVCDDFRPYAKQRIRGSIHDWLRREDLLSRAPVRMSEKYKPPPTNSEPDMDSNRKKKCWVD